MKLNPSAPCVYVHEDTNVVIGQCSCGYPIYEGVHSHCWCGGSAFVGQCHEHDRHVPCWDCLYKYNPETRRRDPGLDEEEQRLRDMAHEPGLAMAFVLDAAMHYVRARREQLADADIAADATWMLLWDKGVELSRAEAT